MSYQIELYLVEECRNISFTDINKIKECLQTDKLSDHYVEKLRCKKMISTIIYHMMIMLLRNYVKFWRKEY